jgi:hypothetical protein
MITTIIEYDHHISVEGKISIRQITRYMDGDEEVAKRYHRKVVDYRDDVSGEDRRTRLFAEILRKEEKVDLEEMLKKLMKIKLDEDDAEELSELNRELDDACNVDTEAGETQESEDVKMEGVVSKIRAFWRRILG